MLRHFLLSIAASSFMVGMNAGAQCVPKLMTFANVVANKQNEIKGPLDVKQLERDNMIQVSETGQWLPFGYANKEWNGFKAATRSGDSIYFVAHRQERFYREDYVLVRKGCVIKVLNNGIS